MEHLLDEVKTAGLDRIAVRAVHLCFEPLRPAVLADRRAEVHATVLSLANPDISLVVKVFVCAWAHEVPVLAADASDLTIDAFPHGRIDVQILRPAAQRYAVKKINELVRRLWQPGSRVSLVARLAKRPTDSAKKMCLVGRIRPNVLAVAERSVEDASLTEISTPRDGKVPVEARTLSRRRRRIHTQDHMDTTA